MWDRFWHFLISAFIAYLMILFSIIVDLYWRDRRTPGLIKAIWLILLIIASYVTALVYLTFERRAWPFERAKPRVPPRRRDRRIHPRGGRLLARAGNRRCCSTPAQSPNRNSTRSKPKRSARPDSSSARQSSGYGRTTIRSEHYGWRRSSSRSVLPDGQANSSTAPVEQRATPAESSAVQGDFTEPRIAVGPERRTARPRCCVIAHNSGGADVAPRARSASPKPTIARGKQPNGATRFHELHQPERRL